MEIEKENSSFVKLAMHYGMILGLFWLFKYLFIIGDGFTSHFFIYFFYLLNVGTFLLIYIIYIKYKNLDMEKPKGLLQSALFMAAVCFFASFFEGLIMFVHYKIIHPESFRDMIRPFINMVNNLPVPQNADVAQFEKAKEIYVGIFSNRVVYIIFNFIGNTILGFTLALLIGIISKSD